MNIYIINIDFGTGYEPIEFESESLVKNEFLYSELQPKDSSVQFSILPDTTLFNKLRGASYSNVPVQILKNNEPYFYGYIKKDYTFRKTQSLDSLGVEIASPSYFLKKKIGKDLYYVNITVTNLISTLLAYAGVTSTVTLPSITSTIPVFKNAYDDDTTYHKVISDLLFEYGYGFRFDNEGNLYCFELFPTEIQSSYIFDGSVNRIEVRQEVKEETYEGVIVNWTGTKTLSDVTIFSDTTNGNSINTCNIEIEPNSYYEFEDGVTQYYAEYDYIDGGAELLAVENVTLEVEKDSDISTELFTPYPLKALLSLKNNNSLLSKNITKLNLKAETAIITGATNVSKVIKVSDTEDLYTYDTTYIHSKDDADNLANGLAWYYNYTDYTYKLSSKVDKPINSIVTISENGLGANLCRVVSKKYKEYLDIIEYELEAVAEYIPAVAENTTTVTSPSPISKPLEAIIPSIVSSSLSGGVIQDAVFGSSWTAIPTVPILGYVPSLKNVILKWDRQNDLSNFSEYQIQVSNDNTTWYALGTDRTSYKSGNAGDYTALAVEQYIHTLPIVEGEIVSYYYRIRRATRETVSAWSSAIYASTTLIDNGDFSADEIYANIVNASSISAGIAAVNSSISIGTDGFTSGNYDSRLAPLIGQRRQYIDNDEITIQEFIQNSEIALNTGTFSFDANTTNVRSYQLIDDNTLVTLEKPSSTYLRYQTKKADGSFSSDYSYTFTSAYIPVAFIIKNKIAYVITVDISWLMKELLIIDLETGTLLNTIDLSTTGYYYEQIGSYDNNCFTLDISGNYLWLVTRKGTGGTVQPHIILFDLDGNILVQDTILEIGQQYIKLFPISGNKVIALSGYCQVIEYDSVNIAFIKGTTKSVSYANYPTCWTKYDEYTYLFLRVYSESSSMDSEYDYSVLTIDGNEIAVRKNRINIVEPALGYLYTNYPYWTVAKINDKIISICSCTTQSYANVFDYDPITYTVTFDFANTLTSYAGATPMVLIKSSYFDLLNITTYIAYQYGYYGIWNDDLVIGRGSSQITADTITSDSLATDTITVNNIGIESDNDLIQLAENEVTINGNITVNTVSTNTLSATTNLRIPTSQPSSLTDGDIWIV
jgi:hypothetical protein